MSGPLLRLEVSSDRKSWRAHAWVGEGGSPMHQGLDFMASELTQTELSLVTMTLQAVLDRLANAERGTVRPGAP